MSCFKKNRRRWEGATDGKKKGSLRLKDHRRQQQRVVFPKTRGGDRVVEKDRSKKGGVLVEGKKPVLSPRNSEVVTVKRWRGGQRVRGGGVGPITKRGRVVLQKVKQKGHLEAKGAGRSLLKRGLGGGGGGPVKKLGNRGRRAGGENCRCLCGQLSKRVSLEVRYKTIGKIPDTPAAQISRGPNCLKGGRGKGNDLKKSM